MIRRLSLVMALLVGLHLALPVRADAAADLAAAEERAGLETAIRTLHEGLRTERQEAKKQALAAIQPTKADVALLFPEDVEILWPRMEKFVALMMEHIDEVANEVAAAPITEFRFTDLRKDAAGREHYAAVFAMIPPAIPAYRLTVKTAGSSTYLFVNAHWIHFHGLEEMPKIIEAIRAG